MSQKHAAVSVTDTLNISFCTRHVFSLAGYIPFWTTRDLARSEIVIVEAFTYPKQRIYRHLILHTTRNFIGCLPHDRPRAGWRTTLNVHRAGINVLRQADPCHVGFVEAELNEITTASCDVRLLPGNPYGAYLSRRGRQCIAVLSVIECFVWLQERSLVMTENCRQIPVVYCLLTTIILKV